jgi:lipoprotein-releasing system permease protein
MSPNLRIAFRFLTAKKRAMLMSLSCTVLGVGLFIVSMATTSGFMQFFIDTILGSDGAIVIADRIQVIAPRLEAGQHGSGFEISLVDAGVRYQAGIEEPGRLREMLRNFPSITGISEVVVGSVTLQSSTRDNPGRLMGIEVDEHLKVSRLGSQIVEGSLDDFRSQPFGAIMGRELAARLQLVPGDSFQMSALGGPFRRYRVSAIFETGISAIDRERLFLSMSDARSLLQRQTGATLLQLSMFEPDRAPIESLRLQEALGHRAVPWQEREKSWLSSFSALQVSSAITVSVFILIAGLAMFNTLAMIVIEKTKDIAILRSMGYERTDITGIFLWQAIIVLVIGAVLGCLFGAAATYGVSRVPIDITGIFATKHFIVAWSPWHYVAAVATAVVMVMIASIIPARRAARLEPGDVVRGTAQ